MLDIPLLVESKAGGYPMAALVVVDAPIDTAVARLVEHRGMAEDDARARIAAQATREERLERANFVIDNAGPVERLAEQVDRCWEWMQGLRA